MRKFFTDFEFIDGKEILSIDQQEAKHILKVLRLKLGDRFIISNFNDQSFEAEIIDTSLGICKVKLLNKIDITNKVRVNITIFQGYPKFDKLEFIVQKLTEIGIREIVPVVTNRVNAKIDISKFKWDRLNKISKEACKQCGISTIPTIKFPIKLTDIDQDEIKKFDLILIPYEKEEFNLKEVISSFDIDKIKNVCVFIGPEGGFEECEVDFVRSLGGISVGLGQNILRTETATIFISSILKYEFGDR